MIKISYTPTPKEYGGIHSFMSSPGVKIWPEVPANAYQLWEDDFSSGIGGILEDYCYVGHNDCLISSGPDSSRFQYNGAGGTGSEFVCAIPNKLAGACNRSQFCRATLLADNSAVGNIVRPLWCVLASGDINVVARAYGLMNRAEANDSLLVELTSATTIASLVAGLTEIAPGETVDIRATIAADQLSVDLEVFVDGVSLVAYTDAATPIIAGLPGLGYRGAGGAGRLCSFNDLSCGIIEYA